MTVSFSDEAFDDLSEIGDAVAAHDKGRAAKLVSTLWDACQSLADMPLRYPLIPRREGHGIRRRPHGNYLIFYITNGDDVTIIHVLHGARDYEQLLFPCD